MNTSCRVFLLLICLVCVRVSFGQTGNILTNLKSEWKRANELYANYSFQAAAELYKEVLRREPSNVQARLQLAACYRKLNDWTNAEMYYAQLVNEPAVTDSMTPYYYAQALFNNGKYAEAEKWYTQYQTKAGNERRVVNKLWGLQNLPQFYKDSAFYQISHLPINTPQSDFSPAYYPDGIVFISAAEKAPVVRHVYTWDETPLLDLYFAPVQKRGNLGKPRLFYAGINSKYHEGPAVFYEEGRKMIFTRSTLREKKLQKNKEGINKLSLFSAEQTAGGKGWTNFRPLPFNQPDFSVGHPALTRDGKTLYFVSDMPGGEGGLDLYVSRWDGAAWGKPANLGPKINTEGNEMFPFIQQDSVLYFASDGYAGLGGLDVYKTDLYGDLAYKVLNMGYPVNTRFDDFGLILDQTGKTGYFASNRPGGKGSDDIYGFSLANIVIESIVANNQNGEPINTPDIKLIDSRTGKELSGAVRGNKVYFEVPPGEHYILKSNQDRFAVKTQVVPTRHWQFGDTLTVNFGLDPVRPTSAPLWVKVIDTENNLPASGAQVYLLNEVSSEEKYLHADSAGLLTFEASFMASYALIAEKGKKSGVLSSIIVNDPAVLANDTLLLPIAAFQPEGNESGQPLFLEGLVIDVSNQESVPNARVRLFDKETQKEIKITQKNGVAGFSVKPGNYILKVDKDTYTDRVVVISARPSPAGNKVRVKIELQKQPPASTPLMAYIYDPVTGKAQAGYEIYLLDETTSEEKYGISDGQGNYPFEAKLASSYALIAEKGNRSGFLSGIIAHDPASQPNEVIQIPVFGRSPQQELISATPDSTLLDPPAATTSLTNQPSADPSPNHQPALAPIVMKGVAVDLADGKPLTDLTFTLINAKTKQEVEGYVENGFQYFSLQPDESYLLKSNKDRYANKTTLINTWENNPGDTINVQVDMTRSIPVSAALVVYIYDEESGQPESGASVLLLDETTSDKKNLKTGENGTLQFTALFTSSYAVVAQKNDKTGSRSNISANLSLSRQDTIRVALAGKARMNEENKVVITVSTTDLDQRDTLWNATITLTDAITRQELKGILTKEGMLFQAKPNGQYVLSGQKTGYKDKSELISTKGITPADTIRKKLLMEAETPLWQTQMVQVYDAESQQPIPGAAVLLLDETTGEEKNLITNKYGNFQFEAFLTSSYSIMADKGNKSGWLTGVVAGDSAIMTKGVIRIPIGRPFAKDPDSSGPLLAYGGAGTRTTPTTVASAGSDSSPRIFSIKNISGTEQVFVHYKSRVFEFKSEENLKYLVPVNTRQKLIVGQEEGPYGNSLTSQLEQVFASGSITPREVVQISSIFYELDKSELTDEARNELDKLAALLLANPSLRIVMKSYADSRESYAYNYDLSNRRSKVAKAYIAAKGIGKGRIQTYFFGEKYPVNGCSDGVECPESEHQKNRRTEFKLVF